MMTTSVLFVASLFLSLVQLVDTYSMTVMPTMIREMLTV